MKTGIITTTAVMGLMLAFSAGDLLAAGRGNGGHGGMAGGTSTRMGTHATGSTATTRPADSQRRDGTFLTTGTTANGSTTRPDNGKLHVQEQTRLNKPATTAPAAAE